MNLVIEKKQLKAQAVKKFTNAVPNDLNVTDKKVFGTFEWAEKNINFITGCKHKGR